MNRYRWLSHLVGCAVVLVMLPLQVGALTAHAQTPRYFSETGKSVGGRFLEYWNRNGALAQQGYPISDEMQETSDTDGRVYMVQYFQRAVFEYHPEKEQPFDVLLSLLGVSYYNEKYGGNAPGQKVSTDNPRRFSETGHTVGGVFRTYWESHGGLAQQGYPISDEFTEVDKDGVARTVQYFQRSVFEYHQEYAGTSNQVLLSLLGVLFYQKKYTGSTPQSGVTPTVVPSGKGGALFFYKKGTGTAAVMELLDDGTYRTVKQYNTFSKDWQFIVPIGDKRLFFYNPSAGDSAVMELDDQGNVNTIQTARLTNSTDRESTHWVSPGAGILFSYKRGSGMAYTNYIDRAGDFVGEKALTGFNTTWTNIVAGSGGILLFYDSASGYAATGVINPDFTFTTAKTYDTYFARGWLSFTPADNGYFVAYGSLVGGNPGGAARSLAVGHIDPYGNVSQARPTIGFENGWNLIASTARGMLLFYSINGRAETGYVDSDGQYAPAQTFGPGSLGVGWTNIVGIK